MTNEHKQEGKHLIDAQYIGMAIAEASAQVFGKTIHEREKYGRDEATSEREVFNTIAATMSQVPLDFAKNINMDVLMLHNSLIVGIASVMAQQNRQILGIIRGLLHEPE